MPVHLTGGPEVFEIIIALDLFYRYPSNVQPSRDRRPGQDRYEYSDFAIKQYDNHPVCLLRYVVKGDFFGFFFSFPIVTRNSTVKTVLSGPKTTRAIFLQ